MLIMDMGTSFQSNSIYAWSSSGWPLGLYFFGFFMNYNKEAKSLTFRRDSEVSQVWAHRG